MQRYHCQVGLLPIRKHPDETAEMLSQMLYGEGCTVTKRQKDHAHILTDDNVSGWVLASGLMEGDKGENRAVIRDNVVHLLLPEGKMLLSFGSEVLLPDDELQPLAPEADNVVALAKKFLHTPYLYGGRSIFGVDASALVQLVYKAVGVALPRYADEQALHGDTLDFVEESTGGELAFFDDDNGHIHHTGIMLGEGKVLHCYGRVRIDEVDTIGIFNADLNKHTHKLRFIKRILP